MTIYKCDKCNFIDENKTLYQRHINTVKHKRNVGEIENTKGIPKVSKEYHLGIPKVSQDATEIVLYECDYCDASFKHTNNKYRHQKNSCKAKMNQMEMMSQIQESHREEIKKITEYNDRRVEQLVKQLNRAMDKINTTNNTTNNTNCTTNIININGYGKEDISYLTNEDWVRIASVPRDSVLKLFSETHFNPEHPENKNIRQTNKKSKFIEVHDGDNWKNENKKKILVDIADDKQGILDDKFIKDDELQNSMSKRQLRNHDTFHDEAYEKHRDEIVEDMEACLLDNMLN